MSSDPICIMHISDLQAGKACLAHIEIQGSKLTPKHRYRYYAEGLAKDVNHLLEEVEVDRVDLLVLSGDVAHTAVKEEYVYASHFLERLLELLGMEDRRQDVIIVPGNHDVSWAALRRVWRGKKKPHDAPTIRACAGHKEKMQNFRNWFNRFYKKGSVRYRYNFGKPVYFDEVRRAELAVVGLDSCELLTHNQAMNKGVVQYDQSEAARKFFSARPAEQKVKIAVLHHNPFPNEDEEDVGDCLKDRSRLLQALHGAGVVLVLAGHMHRARYDRPEPYTGGDPAHYCHVLATGPCCMCHEYRTFRIGKDLFPRGPKSPDNRPKEVMPSRYELIRINPDAMTATVFLRRYSFERRYEDGRWGAWTNDSDPGFVNEEGQRSITFYRSDDDFLSRTAKALNLPDASQLPTLNRSKLQAPGPEG